MPKPPVEPQLDIERLQIQRFRAMGPRRRLAAALELNDVVERLAIAGIRARHGRLPEREERLRLFSLRLESDDMRQAFDWDPADGRG